MSTSLLLVVVLMVASAHALNGLSKIQQPMPGVNSQAIMGQWYTTFRKPPCSYSGSTKYENINQYLSVQEKNAITVRGTWGPKYCTKAFADMVFTPTPGVFLLKDYFGDQLSGRLVVIGTDHKKFIVYWGCTKFSVFGDYCDYPYIIVDTRAPRPNKNTKGQVNAILMQRFGMSINQLDLVLQNGACFAGGSKTPF